MKKQQHTFRFIDERLHASLIEAIRVAGLPHEVTADGSVLYSPGRPFEKLIDQLVGAMFAKGYYRVEISESDKASRYRRFKQLSGTQLVEETRNGRTYFVQEPYEKLYRHRGTPTHVSFVMAEESLVPGRVTSLLGISPAFACLNGELFARPYSKRKQDAPAPLSHQGWWEICSIPHVESNDVQPHLGWLITLLEPLASRLKLLAEESTSKDFRVLQIDIVQPNGLHGIQGVSLDRRTLERLSVLTDRVDIHFWPDDYV